MTIANDNEWEAFMSNSVHAFFTDKGPNPSSNQRMALPNINKLTEWKGTTKQHDVRSNARAMTWDEGDTTLPPIKVRHYSLDATDDMATPSWAYGNAHFWEDQKENDINTSSSSRYENGPHIPPLPQMTRHNMTSPNTSWLRPETEPWTPSDHYVTTTDDNHASSPHHYDMNHYESMPPPPLPPNGYHVNVQACTTPVFPPLPPYQEDKGQYLEMVSDRKVDKKVLYLLSSGKGWYYEVEFKRSRREVFVGMPNYTCGDYVKVEADRGINMGRIATVSQSRDDIVERLKERMISFYDIERLLAKSKCILEEACDMDLSALRTKVQVSDSILIITNDILFSLKKNMGSSHFVVLK